MSMVPAMVRTDPVPTPSRAIASSAALAETRMRGQSEIVVRREIDDVVMIDGRRRLLLVVEHAQLAVEPLLLQGIELGGKESEGIRRMSVVSR